MVFLTAALLVVAFFAVFLAAAFFAVFLAAGASSVAASWAGASPDCSAVWPDSAVSVGSASCGSAVAALLRVRAAVFLVVLRAVFFAAGAGVSSAALVCVLLSGVGA